MIFSAKALTLIEATNDAVWIAATSQAFRASRDFGVPRTFGRMLDV